MGLFLIGTPRSGALPLAQALAVPLREAGGTACIAPDPLGDSGRSHPLTAANDELLAAAGASWLVPPAPEARFSARTAGDRARAASSMRSAFSDRPWIWADPRLAVTLPHWLAAAPDATVLVVLGDAAEFDATLAADLEFPEGYGIALHGRLLGHALDAIEGQDRAVVLDGTAAAAARAVDLVDGLTPDLLAEHISATMTPVADRQETDADRLVFELARQRLEALDATRSHIGTLRRLNADAERRVGTVQDLPDRLAAAETSAAATAADFEEFKQRRSIRAITLWADRYYPAAQKLRSRFGRSGSSAAVDDGAVDVSVRVTPTALGAAARRGDLAGPLTVIVPVYNAPDEVERCIESLAANTPPDTSVLLIDDASTDPAIAPLLEAATGRPRWSLLTNAENLGFTRTINRGLAASPDGDVILLNADTRVGPRWTWRLRNAVYSEARYGTATPLSDSAGAFTFPCVRPRDQAHVDAVATAVARGASFVRPEAPTGNGFCMYIPAHARAIVPTMNETDFPRGYGEENDFCMKLVEVGLTNVIADDCVVFHDESASFGPEKAALLDQGLERLAELWPDYGERVRRFLESPELAEARESARVSAAAPHATDPPARRVLFVSHDGQGGTQHHCDDLAGALQADHEIFLLTPAGPSLAFKQWLDGAWQEIRRLHPADRWWVGQYRSDEMTDALADLISRFDFEIVHIHHLIGQTFDSVEMADALGVPVVVTIHDYYLACPSLNLLDEDGNFCGGTCTSGPGPCQTPEPWVPRGIPVKHLLVHPWQAETTRLLEGVSAVVAPSETARRVMAEALDPALAQRITVIEHGRDLKRAEVAVAPRPDAPIKVLLAGAINLAKGAGALRELIEADVDSELAFEVLGGIDVREIKNLVDLPVRWHGAYDRDHFSARLGRIRPAFVAVLSIWPETYNYVVSEAWAAGVPVVVGASGAPAERVARTGAGLAVDLADPAGAVAALVAAGRDERLYDDMVRCASAAPIRSTAEMADDYRVLYGRCVGAVGTASVGSSSVGSP